MRAGGPLSYASYYGDHMVLQRAPEKAVVWGYGPEGAQVTVSLSGPTEQKTSPVAVTEGECSRSLFRRDHVLSDPDTTFMCQSSLCAITCDS